MTEQFDPSAAAAPGSGVFGLSDDLSTARMVIVPVPWDATTSYRRGTALGPAAVLAASRQVDLFDYETENFWQDGIVMLDEDPAIRAWNTGGRALSEPVIAVGGHVGTDTTLVNAVTNLNALSDRVNAWIDAAVTRQLEASKLVAVLGGEHSVAFGAIAATARRHPGVGVLQIDAHADLRDAFEGFTHSHASVMHNVCTRVPDVARLVQVGIRDLSEDERAMIRTSGGRVTTFFDTDLRAAQFSGATWAAQCAQIVAALPSDVHISFDIDGLDPSLCPSTGTPVPGGLSFAEATYLIGAVAKSGRRIVSCDLVEVAPAPSGGGDWDANVGARVLYKMLGWMALSQRT